ncbi:MAG: phosphatidylglycerophosphatase A [Phycisphaerales bacterium]|nr:phosphatidylglycerophosphatase A [Phycisphaerales bacterium]
MSHSHMQPLHRPKFLLPTTFGLGHLPASGTWGSIPTVVLAGLLIAFGLGPVSSPFLYHLVLLVVLVVFSLATVLRGEETEAFFLGEDPSEVVADETAGQCIPLFALPIGMDPSFWRVSFALLLAFLAFRFFDIVKVWPANALQRIRGGWGILLDDIAAGVYALIFVQVVFALVVR